MSSPQHYQGWRRQRTARVAFAFAFSHLSLEVASKPPRKSKPSVVQGTDEPNGLVSHFIYLLASLEKDREKQHEGPKRKQEWFTATLI